jgi:hypothetical protein
MVMTRSRAVGWSLVAWLLVGVFWYIVTRNYHPTRMLAVIVTVSLVTTYAVACYINHLALIPCYAQRGRYGAYAVALLITMVVLTSLTLAVNRSSYILSLGSDPDPNGLYKHFGIDFFGMAAHLLVAAGVVWIVGRVVRPR